MPVKDYVKIARAMESNGNPFLSVLMPSAAATANPFILHSLYLTAPHLTACDLAGGETVSPPCLLQTGGKLDLEPEIVHAYIHTYIP